MEAIVLLVLLGLGLNLGLPIAAIVLAVQAKERAKRAASALREIEPSLGAAVEQNRELNRRLDAWIAYAQKPPAEQQVAAAHEVVAPAGSPPARAQAVPTAVVASTAEAVPGAEAVAPACVVTTPEAVADTAANTAANAAATPSDETAPNDGWSERNRDAGAAEPSHGIDWERLVGVRLFAWVGGAALFLAGALFLHYSIQQNLVSPEVRVALALVVGAGCLAAGDRLRVRTPFTGFALSGAGVAILYAALFAARSLYDLIGTMPAFMGMSLVTVTAGFIAVKRNAYFVALLGLTGGMATPFLLSTGEDRPVALFAYVSLLSAAVLVVAKMRRWASLAVLGVGFAAVIFTAWSSEHLKPERVPWALLAATIVGAMFALTRTLGPPPAEDSDRGGRRDLAIAANVGALLVLLVITSSIASTVALQVEPLVLSLHLIAVSGIAVLVARQHSQRWLLVAAAVGSLLTLLLRVNADLFPTRYELALACLSLPAIAYFCGWLGLRARDESRAAWQATLVLLVGSLAILLRVVDVAPSGFAFAPSFVPLVAYAALHAALLVVMGVVQRRGLPVALGHAVWMLALVALATVAFDDGRICYAAFASSPVFFAMPTLHPRCRGDRLAWLSSACALPLGFALVLSIGHDDFGYDLFGGLAVVAAALEVGLLAFAGSQQELPREAVLALRALFGALALGFLTASVPILLQNEWITISWALEVAALAWLHRRIPHRGLVLLVGGLALAVGVRLLLNPALYEYHARAATPILNHYLYTMGVPAAAFFLAAHLFVLPPEYARMRFKGLLRTAATLFLFVLLNVEIADYFSVGAALFFRWTGGGLAQDMTYSLAWGVFAIALLITGILVKQRPVRIGALAVLVLTVGKVFVHDLHALGGLYRVGSIVGLAVALLGVSFVTQRLILDRKEAP